MSTDRTYEEQQQDAAATWQANRAAHASKMQTRAEQLAHSPDVQQAPSVGSTWNHDLVICPCTGTRYTMRRWACINGIRTRTEVECLACHRVGTWDWQEGRWLH